ncbi:MAG: hypothetical protein ABIY90_17765 [Puia sp.]
MASDQPGLNSFTLTPQLPDEWDYMRLKKIDGFQKTFDIDVKREEGNVRLTVKTDETTVFDKVVKAGAAQYIQF